MKVRDFPGLEAYLDAEVAKVQAALHRASERLERLGPSTPGGSEAATPALGVDVLAALRHGLLSGGKRLRPILCATAYVTCGGRSTDAAYDLAVSLEMIHAYSLMHDDLPCMDDAELRRGRPTTHRVHGEESTMTAGAVLIPVAALTALRAARALGCGEDRARRVASQLMQAAGAGGMVGGQWLDLQGEGAALEPEELDRLHQRKTGALLAASLLMGATAAGASDAVHDAMASYGRAVGLAFQITDDILDATASSQALGKNPSDTELDKSTYVALYGLEAARTHADALVDRALDALQEADVDSPPLEALARYVVERGS